MTVEEIIAEIDEKCPNGLGTESKVRKINNLHKKLFRTIVKRTITKTINMLDGAYLYLYDASPDKIREVLVNGIVYPYRQLEGMVDSKFFYIVDNYIGIYPTPSEDITDGILIFRYQEPTELTLTSQTPDLDEDYHSILVYGVCKEVAEINKEFDISREWLILYNSEIDEYEKANQDTEPSQIQEEARW